MNGTGIVLSRLYAREGKERCAIRDSADRLGALQSKRAAAAGLEAAGQQQDQQNQEDETQTAAGRIAPAAAVRPGGKGSEQQKYEENDENNRHGFSLPITHELANTVTLRGARIRGAYRRLVLHEASQTPAVVSAVEQVEFGPS